ncbi:MAG: ChbG/HpnK family deacetylase, partial [bacterium]
MRAPLRLIINVDDLGLHPAVRRAIEECAALGTVTSASVLANGPDIDAVKPIAGVSFGAHLNILRGKPLSPAHEVRSLV